MKINDFVNVLKSTGIDLFNTYKKSTARLPYMFYNEYMQTYKKSDNHISYTIHHIQVDLYADLSDAASCETVKNTLDKNEVPFEYRRLYQEDIETVHHIFDCEVIL